MKHLPKPLVKAPGRLKSVINGLIDFARQAKPRAGAGLLMQETPDGIELSINEALQEILDKHKNEQSGVEEEQTGGTFEWPASSLVTVDETTGDLETAPDKVIAMREINVCVDAGNGSYTPAKMKVLGTATYT